jgi:16S rRNA (adenine1518-N6/adenine1519-N6)-dimethyltransferase
MSTLPPLDVPALLRMHDLLPNKRLGQNFLVDENALQRIADVAGISAQEAVLEIGPGLGSLTRHLAIRAQSVTAVELDRRLIPVLRENLSAFANIRLVEGNILSLDLALLVGESSFLVVANIPYYITSSLIRHLLEARRQPQRLILTVQEEVARRICAGPGEMSLLALSVQVYGQPQIAAHIPANAFYPPPKVDSSVIRIDIFPAARIPPDQMGRFFQLAKAGFSQKRKTLRNSLAGGMHWEPAQAGELLNKAGIDPMRRPETLSLDEWKGLVTVIATANPA